MILDNIFYLYICKRFVIRRETIHMKNFLKKHKYSITLLAVLLLVVVCSGVYLYATRNTYHVTRNINEPINKLSSEQAGTVKKNTTTEQEYSSSTKQYINIETLQHKKTATLKQKTDSINKPINPLAAASDLPQGDKSTNKLVDKKKTLETIIYVNDKEYKVDIYSTSTAYQAMQVLSKESDFSFKGQNYPSIGFFVNEINGIKNDLKNNKYWIYYINNQSAKVGVSNYLIKTGDIITWKYEESKF